MFQFRRFPTYTYLIQCTLHGYCPCGLPHSEIRGLSDICSSPRLIAACHVLRRLLMPRHSPCALFSLTYRRRNSLHSVSAFRRKLHIRSFLKNLRIFEELGDGGCGETLSFNSSEKIWFSQELCRLHRLFEIVIVTLRPFGRSSTIIILPYSRMAPLCCLTYHLCCIVQFSRCARRPKVHSAPLPPPAKASLHFLAPPLRRKQVFADGDGDASDSFEARSKHLIPIKCFDLISMVEIVGFEPATSCLQGRRSPS